MQTKTYGSLFKLIQSLAGVNSFTEEEQADISRFINRRYFQAYNFSQNWVRYLVPAEARTVSTFSATGVNNSRNYNGLYFKYADDANGNPLYRLTGKNPLVDNPNTNTFTKDNTNGQWRLKGGNFTINVETGVGTFTGFIALAIQRDTSLKYDNPWNAVWQQTSTTETLQLKEESVVPFVDIYDVYSNDDPVVFKEEIGEFIRIYRGEALKDNSVLEYDFFVDEQGAHILNMEGNNSNKVFVTYKKKFTEFTTSSNYTTSTEEVPEEFFAFIAHAVYADFLRMDGQHQKAFLEEQTAQGALDLQLERNDIISNNNNATMRFSTYVSRQSR